MPALLRAFYFKNNKPNPNDVGGTLKTFIYEKRPENSGALLFSVHAIADSEELRVMVQHYADPDNRTHDYTSWSVDLDSLVSYEFARRVLWHQAHLPDRWYSTGQCHLTTPMHIFRRGGVHAAYLQNGHAVFEVDEGSAKSLAVEVDFRGMAILKHHLEIWLKTHQTVSTLKLLGLVKEVH